MPPSCRYCFTEFTPSIYRPNQAVCGQPECQRRRRAEYHRNKLRNDPTYRAQCRDSQRQWREQNPNYMREYRADRSEGNARPSEMMERLVGRLRREKNNVAIELKDCRASIFLVTSDPRVKNIVASAEIIIINGLSQLSRAPGACKEHPLGAS